MVRDARDHYRPVLHLRHFADNDGLLWAFDRSGKTNPFRQIAPNVGFEKGLYTIIEPPDGDSGAFEAWLADYIDGPAVEALDKFADARSLTSKERSRLAIFIAAQDMRTPRARDRVLAIFRDGLGEQWEQWRSTPSTVADAIEQDSGTRPPEEDLVEFLQMHEPEITANQWFDSVQSWVNKGGERIYGMRWLRVYAPPGDEFITSDVGIVKCRGRINDFVDWEVGFTGGRDGWIFAVKPDVCLVLVPPGPPDASGTCKQEWLRAVNKHMWADAHRWVFSRKQLPHGGPE
jgi:hypothetical protein